MTKLLLRYLLFATKFFAAGAAVIPAAGAGGSGAPAAGGGAGQPAGGEGSQPAAGGQPAAGAQPQGDSNIRQLREAYEGIKAKFEPWEKLNLKPEQVTQYSGVYQKVYTAAAEIGRQLGYPDDEISEALATDPIRTLDFLRSQAAQGEQNQDGDQDLQELVAQHVEQAIGPIQQRENVRMTNEANALFERTVHGLAVESFKAEGVDVANIPQDEMFMLTSAVSEILKYDPAALQALKYEGKTAAIQKAFTEARGMLDKYYLARAGRERARVVPPGGGNQGGQQTNGQQRKPTLDEMIENPSVIDEAQGRRGTDGRYR